MLAGKSTELERLFDAHCPPTNLVWSAIEHCEHAVLFAQKASYRASSIDIQWLEFSQKQQAENMVEISARQYDATQRRAVCSGPRL